MARESRSRSVMPVVAAGVGTGRTLGRNLTGDLDTGLPVRPQVHPNRATEA